MFAGSKQKELEVGSMALMAGYTPIATVLLAILVPIFEPVGFSSQSEDTLFGFEYTPKVIALPRNPPSSPPQSAMLLSAGPASFTLSEHLYKVYQLMMKKA